MKPKLLLLLSLAALAPRLAAAQSRTVMVNSNGTLLAPTNFFAVNAALLPAPTNAIGNWIAASNAPLASTSYVASAVSGATNPVPGWLAPLQWGSANLTNWGALATNLLVPTPTNAIQAWIAASNAPLQWGSANLTNWAALGTNALATVPAGVVTNYQSGVTLNHAILAGSLWLTSAPPTAGSIDAMVMGNTLYFNGALQAAEFRGSIPSSSALAPAPASGALLRSDGTTNQWVSSLDVSNVVASGTFTGNGSGLTNLTTPASTILPVSTPFRVIFEGDSLTATNTRLAWPWHVLTNDSRFADCHDVAAGGSSLLTVMSRYTNYVQPWKPAGGTNAILSLLIGANDMESGVPVWTADYSNYVRQARADGFLVVAWTFSGWTNYAFGTVGEATRIARNDYIRRSGQWDWLVDWAAMAPNPRDTTWFVDGVHPTDFGYSMMAKLFLHTVRQSPVTTFDARTSVVVDANAGWGVYSSGGLVRFSVNGADGLARVGSSNLNASLVVHGSGYVSNAIAAAEVKAMGYANGSNYVVVRDNRSTTGDSAGITFGTSTDGGLTKSLIAHVETGANGIGDLVFAVDGATDGASVQLSDEKLRIKSDGNVVLSAGGLTLPVLSAAPAVTGNNGVLWLSNSSAPVIWITTTNGTFAPH